MTMTLSALEKLMKRMASFGSVFLLIFAGLSNASANCTTELPVTGTLAIDACDPKKHQCIPAEKVIYEYSRKEDNPKTFSIAAHGSPWHLFDQDLRIVRVEELVKTIRSGLIGKKSSVELIASWSGVRPNSNTPSIAQKLSESLGGVQVKGQDGFLWLKSNGKTRITRQAFTVFQSGGAYEVRKGKDVMVSMTFGWGISMEDRFAKEKNSKGLLFTAVAWEVFGLCIDKALQLYELAASEGNDISAFNAAVMRLERGHPGDRTKAIELLTQSGANGDEKSRQLLTELNANGSESKEKATTR